MPNTNPDIKELDMESSDVEGVTSPPAGHLLPADWSLRAIYVRHKLYARVQYAANSHRPAEEAPTYRMVDTDSYLAPFQLGVSQLTQFNFASFKRWVIRQSMQQAGASMPHPINIVSVYADFMDILTWKYAVNQLAKVPMKVLNSNRFSMFQAEVLEAPPKTQVWISLEMDTKAISLQSNPVLTIITNPPNVMKTPLVKGKLDVYGRLTSRKATAAVTPFSAIKATIRQHEQKHPDQFNLPPNYADNAKWNSELDSMITLALKADKHKILSDLVTSIFLEMLPRYKDSDPATILREVKAPAKARLAHMRLIFNLNQIARNNQGEKHTFWSQLDADLALQIGKSPMYRFGFARLILRKDAALWDGKKTVDCVTAADCAMPTAAEVEEEIAAYHRQGGEDLANPALANADNFSEAYFWALSHPSFHLLTK
ncbi:hypothetical protein PtB15_16B210 [Puccinia triticina]|nr:hypothetical protein PtB15_16B210 [Puccinia triticina]